MTIESGSEKSAGFITSGKESAEFMLVTPQMAAEWLKTNTDNRHLSEVTVKSLANAIVSGEFVTGTDAIGFDTNGVLVNGQHRLHAIVLSGVAVKLLVVRNIHVDAFKVLDIGKRRTAADAFKRLGIPNPKVLAPAASVAATYLGGGYFTAPNRGKGKKKVPGARSVDVSPTALCEFTGMFPDFVENHELAPAGKYLRMTPSKVYGWHWLFSKVNPEKATEFMEGVLTCADVPKDSPIMAFRNFLFDHMEKRVSETKLAQILIDAWNLFEAGKKARKIAIGDTTPVPEIVGLDESMYTFEREGNANEK